MKTLKVRIAVAVDPKTMQWNSSGWKFKNEVSDKDKMTVAVDPMSEDCQRFWIEAELPIEEQNVISGNVSTDE